MCEEYTHRYEKVHKCQAVIQDCIDNPPEFTNTEITEFPQAMDEEYKMDDPIMAYRNYYNKGKAHLHDWKKRTTPEWIEIENEIL